MPQRRAFFGTQEGEGGWCVGKEGQAICRYSCTWDRMLQLWVYGRFFRRGKGEWEKASHRTRYIQYAYDRDIVGEGFGAVQETGLLKGQQTSKPTHPRDIHRFSSNSK